MLNDVRADSTASIDNATIDAASLAVVASELAQIVATSTSTVEASGGSFSGGGTVQAINGQIATNVVLADAHASVNDSTIDVTGDVVVEATNAAGIDATVLTSTTSGDLAVSIALAFNTIGWASQNFLFNAIDAILGDSLISSALYPNAQAETHASIARTDITAGGSVLIGAHGEELVNATVSNAASSAASALYGANGKAVGGIIAMNKVRSDVRAWYELGTTDVTGAFDVIAEDAAGIFANVKMVSSSVTSNDGGVGIAQDYITNAVDFQYQQHRGRPVRRSSASGYASPPARSSTTSPPTTPAST